MLFPVQMALPQAFGDGGDLLTTEVVDANMGDVGGKVLVFGLRIGRIERQADEVEVGAGAQAAYGAAGQPAALPGFAGFHGEAVKFPEGPRGETTSLKGTWTAT